ncbi:MAG: histidine--tRNA ligase [Pirellulaceae bacterium]|nr:histidine--tRNA ligase [Pirellulaceae bacterium]
MIEPRTLKGFRDCLPEVMIPREQLMEAARRVYRRFGFVPIDTPALEYAEILVGKGSEETDRQMYRFEHGGKQIGMRFDLTIPLARFVAQHISQLGTPFKRYHIAPVWRGEKPQAGRFREFVQCDFDTIGTESVVADIETAIVIADLMKEIGIDRFQLRMNNRQILNGMLEKLSLQDKSVAVLRALDKLEKLGAETVRKELQDPGGLSDSQIDEILALANIQGNTAEVLDQLTDNLRGVELGMRGVERLRSIADALNSYGISADSFRIDVTIARGLDYYTGVVFETTLLDLPRIGSICSGGRYDNLAGLYTKQHLPGIGASLGLDRLIAALDLLGKLPQSRSSAQIFVPFFDADRLHDYMRLCQIVRQAGWNVEFYPEPKKLGTQLKYADERGFALALVAGSNELNEGSCQVKNLRHKTSTTASWRDNPQPLIMAITDSMAMITGTRIA